MTKFEILDELKEIETIATGRGVYIRRYLQRVYGKGHWRKMKGTGTKPMAWAEKSLRSRR
jgi:hypothetical protein